MNNLKGLLRIRIKRGVNLAVRDINTSDPYIVVRMGKQEVYDHDFFSTDDKMGDSEFYILPFLEGLKMNLKSVPSGTVITQIKPSKSNCLTEESIITWRNNAVVQDLRLRLRNVECGEIEIELHWIDVPGCNLV
uniref:protein C2-DOMAIN ABA-RELATED 4-like n=1 Tax=Erigeron canadensis TaxID=72917 RepID=UPI001CB89518|nr:protein C2-DOMAIN ABA-RELATED 4-like [Erigeron canadensis]